MSALDTNVLVRLLVGVDPDQLEIVRRHIGSEERSDTYFVATSVTLELEWVLRSRYGFEIDTIIDTFARLLETCEIEFEDESMIERTLGLCGDGAADFADCPHVAVALAHDRFPLVTLIARLRGFPGRCCSNSDTSATDERAFTDW